MFTENVSLASFTTLGIGGPARWWTEARTDDEIRDALRHAERLGLQAFVLGGGSNLVVADNGYPGVVVKVAARGLRHEPDADNKRVLVTVGAGDDWDALVKTCAENGWAGVECLAGIPGTVGATPVQNVGAYGQEVAETLAFVRAFDRVEKRVVQIPADECRFGYRTSRFNTTETGRWVILSVTFSLQPGGWPTLRYPDLRRHFENRRAALTLKDVYHAVREIRAQKGMVVDPKDPDSRSAGSFFKNPNVSAKAFAALEAHWRTTSDDPLAIIPNYPQRDSSVKVPAAWLIERSGFARGQALSGAVAISSKHVLALTNRGGATAADIVLSAQTIQTSVKETWGVTLHPEPVFVGFAPKTTLLAGAVRAA